MKKKDKGTTIAFWVRKEQVKWIDDLIEGGRYSYSSRSEFLRALIDVYFGCSFRKSGGTDGN